ncbi:cytochrome c oxidase accessory protein CcoG [Thalassotalea ponticola]|uniref:cytochrome c oxidase accessory protein CcoG n=1 Tax=Thalassotalea ponticola TaxID=1523392 RepID=UPI0025B578FF|nr:cytochrome c oxidase accessory protein CcoG [Thalassotalea ponticola]MDN3652445.1 cytochrome c oxidase accessory protein CcoG [Thalassotalea ponticola]
MASENKPTNTAKNVIPVKQIKVDKPRSSTVEQYKPRDQIYVRKVEGFFQRLRRKMNLFFLALFALIPWINYNGQQAVLFDIGEQRFNIFALTLWPQDLTLLAWLFIIGAFLLFFVTTFLGRVWCGYLCPQTVWTFIFIWFEEKFEGAANKRKKLDQKAMDFDKFWRKAAKHSCWVIFSLFTAITFVGYFTPIRELVVDFFTFKASLMATAIILFFTFCTYGNAGWMREVMCLHMCPYARFQSAMFDQDTLTVSYDAKRGENRGPRPRKADPQELGLGDCIDCNLCVEVCPTGIDIRNGLQYECINCGACVDACNGVMERMNYDKNLISYTTETALNGKTVHILRPKLFMYAVVLLVMAGLFVGDLATRQPLQLDIIRDRNTLARENIDGLIENVYTLKILNKSQQTATYKLSVDGLTSHVWQGQDTVTVNGAGIETVTVSLAVDPYEIKAFTTDINFVVQQVDPQADDVIIRQQSVFFNKR